MDGTTYHIGKISPFALMRIYLTQYFLLLLLLVTLLSFVVARWVHAWLTLAAGGQHAVARNSMQRLTRKLALSAPRGREIVKGVSCEASVRSRAGCLAAKASG